MLHQNPEIFSFKMNSDDILPHIIKYLAWKRGERGSTIYFDKSTILKFSLVSKQWHQIIYRLATKKISIEFSENTNRIQTNKRVDILKKYGKMTKSLDIKNWDTRFEWLILHVLPIYLPNLMTLEINCKFDYLFYLFYKRTMIFRLLSCFVTFVIAVI